eukprot:COSAG06_NODE_64898_length_258_cov_0.679245_1_plen_85_part_11
MAEVYSGWLSTAGAADGAGCAAAADRAAAGPAGANNAQQWSLIQWAGLVEQLQRQGPPVGTGTDGDSLSLTPTALPSGCTLWRLD